MEQPSLEVAPPGASPDHPSEDFESEEDLSQSPEGKEDIARLCTELAKTARSFLFYDGKNDAILHFLTSLRDRIAKVLDDLGELELAVWPFELWHEEACVYVNRDRERSLAFRLYRDGLRRMTLKRGFTDAELGKLLEALSVRYTGIHQNEDDMVTLLWKASFDHLDIVAVEGLVLDSEDESARTTRGPQSSGESQIPGTVDLPGPFIQPGEGIYWVDVPGVAKERLLREAGSGGIADECLALIDSLCEILEDPIEASTMAELGPGLEEILTFLLSPRTLAAFHRGLERVRCLEAKDAPKWDPGRLLSLKTLEDRLASEDALRHLFKAAAGEGEALVPAIMNTLTRLSADPMGVSLRLLEDENVGRLRRLRRALLTAYGREDPATLKHHFKGKFGVLALEILELILENGGEDEAAFIAEQLGHPDPAVQEWARDVMDSMPYSSAVGGHIAHAFSEGDKTLKLALLPLIASSGDPRFLPLLDKLVHHRALSLEDAFSFGKAMGIVGGSAKEEEWIRRLTPEGFLVKQLPGIYVEQVSAAAALAACPGRAAMDTLKVAMRRGNETVNPYFSRALLRLGSQGQGVKA